MTLFDNKIIHRPAQYVTTNRFYWRCRDCLAVFAVEGFNGKLSCACGGSCEHLGQVTGMRLTETHHVCPCDGRCTGARGPNCDCHCGGENHGTGMLVQIVRDVGPVPKASNAPRMDIANEYRAAVKAAENHISILSYTRNPWSQRNWLSTAKGYASHGPRMKLLAKILEQK